MKKCLYAALLIPILSLGCGNIASPPAPIEPVVNYLITQSAETVFNKAQNSVFEIFEETKEKPAFSTGTGFTIKHKGKIILVTAAHVVTPDTSKYFFQYKEKLIPLSLIKKDDKNDIALLSFDLKEKLPFLQTIETTPRQGESVYTIGFPLDYSKYITEGVANYRNPAENYFYTTIPLAYGNSGGPLLNKEGKVYGVAIQIRPGWPQFSVFALWKDLLR